MTINGKNYLLLERRGCEYFKDDAGRDDINNYRVGSYDRSIIGKDGRRYILEFSSWDARQTRTANRRTGAALKKPITEIVKYNALYISTEFEKAEDGGKWFSSWRNAEMEREQNAKIRDYSIAGILETVNEISADHYDGILWVETFRTSRPEGENWRPATLIYNWARESRLETRNEYGETIVKMYSGDYKFLCYQTPNGGISKDGKTDYIIYLVRTDCRMASEAA